MYRDSQRYSQYKLDSAVGNGSRLIDGNWDDTVSTSEAYPVWQHLRLANLVEGPTDNDNPATGSMLATLDSM